MTRVAPSCTAAALVMALVTSLATRDACAQVPVPVPVPDDADVVQRTAWIQHALDAQTPGACRWYVGWTVAQGALLLGQGIAAPFVHDPMYQSSLIVGAGTAAIGTGAKLIFPLAACFAADELRRIPGDTESARLARLRRAERILEHAAVDEEQGRSWLFHVLGGVVGVGAGLVIGLAFHQRWESAVLTGAVVIGVNEAQMWSQPTAAVSAWRAYRRGEGVAPVRVSVGVTGMQLRF